MRNEEDSASSKEACKGSTSATKERKEVMHEGGGFGPLLSHSKELLWMIN